MNPVLLGIYRRQYQEALRRASMIRMDIASRTDYLNPQLYSAYLSGFSAGMPSDMEGPLLQSLAGSRYAGTGDLGGLLPVQPYAPALPPAYTMPGQPGIGISPVDHAYNLINMRRNALRAVASIGTRPE